MGFYGLPPIEQKTLDGCGTRSFIPPRVGETGGRLGRNKNARSTKQGVVVEFYGLPPIEQKTLDGWGTRSFIPPRVGETGGRLGRNKNARSTKQGVVGEFYGLPPIKQKTLDGWGTRSFIPSRAGEAGGRLTLLKIWPPVADIECSGLRRRPREGLLMIDFLIGVVFIAIVVSAAILSSVQLGSPRSGDL